jgi:hypothetical protein
MPDKGDDTGDVTGAQRALAKGLSSLDSLSHPVLRNEALIGLPGEVVRAITPHSEADPVALLLHFLTMFGNAIGRGPFIKLGPDEHPARLFSVIVGDAATARKGTAGSEIERLMRDADSKWFQRALTSGLQSAEAIVDAVDDERKNTSELMVYYTEFGGLLNAIKLRPNLSDIIKQAFDGKTLKVVTKNKSGRRTASHAHVSVMGHVTPTILADRLSDTEIASGFGNRFLFAAVDRSKLISRPDPVSDDVFDDLADKVDETLSWVNEWTFEGVDPISAFLYRHFEVKPKREMHLSDAAWNLWDTMYPELSAKRAGIVGDLSGRASSHVIRLAVVYAIAERSVVVDVRHLLAGKAVWDYCEASIASIFAGETGDWTVDKVLRSLEAAPDRTMTRTDIWAMFSRHHAASWIDGVVKRLLETGRVETKTHSTGGRPLTTYTLRESEESEKTSAIQVAEPK